MTKSVLIAAVTVAAFGFSAFSTAAAPLATSAPGAYSGNAYTDYSNPLAYSSERAIACASFDNKLVLVNISGRPIKAGARIRYNIGHGPYQEYRLSAPMKPLDQVKPGMDAHLPFQCNVRLLF